MSENVLLRLFWALFAQISVHIQIAVDPYVVHRIVFEASFGCVWIYFRWPLFSFVYIHLFYQKEVGKKLTKNEQNVTFLPILSEKHWFERIYAGTFGWLKTNKKWTKSKKYAYFAYFLGIWAYISRSSHATWAPIMQAQVGSSHVTPQVDVRSIWK